MDRDILKKTKGVIFNNILLSGITRGVGMQLVMNCPALRQDIGPFEDLSVLTKFALVQQVVRTCFCDCLTKCIARVQRGPIIRQLLLCLPELLDKF